MTKERVSNLEIYAQSTSTVSSGQHQRTKGTTKVGKKKKECKLYKLYRVGQISTGYLCQLQRGWCLGMSGCLRACDGFLGDRLELKVAILLFGRTEILHTVTGMGSTALAAAVPYPGMVS